MKRAKVYVGCALTNAPLEFRENVEKLKERLGEICEVMMFKGLSPDNSPRDVYLHDILECVNRCDLMVAICDFPSTGLGWEMAFQIELRRKPLLAVAHMDSKVTKLIMDPQISGYDFARYDDLYEDVYQMVAEKLKRL